MGNHWFPIKTIWAISPAGYRPVAGRRAKKQFLSFWARRPNRLVVGRTGVEPVTYRM